MSQPTLQLVGGGLTAVLLLVLGARTVLVEFRAGRGDASAHSMRRTAPVRVLDIAGIVLMIVIVVILMIPLAAALGN
jgi:ABC-type Fe3+ transport system permease subunit